MSASTGTTVTVLVAALVVLGVAMIGVAVWLIRATRSDPPALGPLEVMGARRWRRGDADRRQTKLDTARPPGAAPPAAPLALESAAGNGDGGTEGAGNCEPSMQESAVSAHSSPAEPANSDASVADPTPSGQSSPVDAGSEVSDDDGDRDRDGAEAPDPGLEPDEPPNSDASVGESTLSGQSSPEEPTESEAAIETNTTE
jgi:hypothetical protein